MNFNILKQIRQDLYESLERGADALFNLGDALLCESQAQSLPELSLSPVFERQWPSVYEALEDGRINVEQVRAIWVSVLLADRAENETIWIAVDGSNIARPSAPTSADRTIIHLPNLPLVDKAGSHGRTFSTVVLVPEQTSSWTPILDQQRITSELELVAWGMRNAFAIGFLPDGRLLAIDQGADDRGTRPVGNVPDLLFEVRQDAWYGWPDFIGGEPITHPKFLPTRGPAPTFLLANHPELPEPEKPLLQFPPHIAAVKFDVAPATVRNYAGHIYIALFGDEAPMCLPTGSPRVGRSVGRIDPHDWSLHPVAMGPLNRPIDVRFGPADGALYVLDFGSFEMREGGGLDAEAGSGKIWRISLFPTLTEGCDTPTATYHRE